jgi:hypothetical protein
MQSRLHKYYTNQELKQILLDLKEKYEEDFAFVGDASQVVSSKKSPWFYGILVNCKKDSLKKDWLKYHTGIRELRGNAEVESAYFTPVTNIDEFFKNDDSVWMELKNFMVEEVEVKEMIL